MSLPRAPQTGCQLATTAILDPAAPEDVWSKTGFRGLNQFTLTSFEGLSLNCPPKLFAQKPYFP